MVRYRQLRDREALGILVLVVRDFPDDAQARDLLGRVLYRLGENARAIEEWEHALRLRPEDTKLAERLERARKDEAIEKDLYLDLTAAHFAIKYDGARDQAVGQQVSRVLEAAYQSVGALLGRYPRTEISVVVYPGKTFRRDHGCARLGGGTLRRQDSRAGTGTGESTRGRSATRSDPRIRTRAPAGGWRSASADMAPRGLRSNRGRANTG